MMSGCPDVDRTLVREQLPIGVDSHAVDRDRVTREAKGRGNVREADARLLAAGGAEVAFVVREPGEEVFVRARPLHRVARAT